MDLPESDLLLLQALFDVHDTDSDRVIDYRDYLVGLSVFVTGNVGDKLKSAFRVYDEEITSKMGMLVSGEAKKVLVALNKTCMFFGDPGLSDMQIREIVIDTYKKAAPISTAPIKYMDHIVDFKNHPRFVSFLEARGHERFSYRPQVHP